MTSTTTRRAVLAGTAALAGAAALPALPAAIAEAAPALSPARQIDRAAFANRLHMWAMQVPQMGSRVDAMLANVDHVLATEDGMQMLLDAVGVCDERDGREISFNWLLGGDTLYPEARMWMNEPVRSPDEGRAELARLIDEVEPRDVPALHMVLGAIKAGDYKNARDWAEFGYRQAGVTIEQW